MLDTITRPQRWNESSLAWVDISVGFWLLLPHDTFGPTSAYRVWDVYLGTRSGSSEAAFGLLILVAGLLLAWGPFRWRSALLMTHAMVWTFIGILLMAGNIGGIGWIMCSHQIIMAGWGLVGRRVHPARRLLREAISGQLGAETGRPVN